MTHAEIAKLLVSRHPSGGFSDEAKAKIKELEEEVADLKDKNANLQLELDNYNDEWEDPSPLKVEIVELKERVKELNTKVETQRELIEILSKKTDPPVGTSASRPPSPPVRTGAPAAKKGGSHQDVRRALPAGYSRARTLRQFT